jgi:organic radical activating enzyme
MTLQNEMLRKARGRNLSATPPFPSKLKIDICGTCNHRCIFCPTAVQTGRHGYIDEELCVRIITDSYNLGARELAFSAIGEPLINPKLEEYITLAKKIGYSYVFINTNGELLNKNRALSLLNSGVDSIKISINAGESETYRLIHGTDCFDKIIENVKFFNERREEKRREEKRREEKRREEKRCKLLVSFVTVKENFGQEKLLKTQIEKYIDEMVVFNANTRGGSIGAETFGESILENDSYSFTFPCGQLFDTVIVLSEGYLVVCCQDFDKLTVIADLHNTSIEDAWNCEKFVNFRKKYLAKDFNGTLCNNCLFGREDDVLPLTPEVAHFLISEDKMNDRKERIKRLKNESKDC